MAFFLVFAGGLICLVLLGTMVTLFHQTNIEERFPPISDAEFLALCPPGTNSTIALRVRQVVAEQMGVKYECIYPNTRFVDDLGMD